MQYLPHQLTRRGFAILGLFLSLLVAGCAGGPEKPEFVPPVFPSPPETPRFVYERTLISSADVEELSTAERFRMLATGAGRDAMGLAKPYGVAVHKGRVYVTDTVQRAVAMFDIPGKHYKLFGTEGLGILAKPIGIDISKDGEVYVVDISARRVVVYDADGNYLRAIGGKDYLTRPSGVAVSPDGSRLYVVDTGGVSSDQHRVQVFDAKTGDLLQTIGTRGVKEGEFNLPAQAAMDKDGNLYVVDAGNFRVEGFNPDGSFKLVFGSVGRRMGQFSRPKGIATDAEGRIYVADAAFGNFQLFDNKGQLLMFVGSRGNRNEPAKYMLPAGIDVDEDGRVYMVDQFFRKVDVYRPYGLKPEEGYAGTGAKDEKAGANK